MLDITDMSKAEKLFNFLFELQTWGNLELRRQSVKDLHSAITMTNALVDFRASGIADSKGKDP